MPSIRINGQITAPELRVIDDRDEFLGILPLAEALKMAQLKGLDLVEVSPKAQPPVAKLVDYGKYLYRQKKLEHKHTSHKTETKGIRISIRTGEHDMQVKAKQAEKFLARHDRVKVQLMFKGREITHFELGIAKMHQFAEMLKTLSEIDEPPKKQGRSVIMVLKPKS